MSRERANGTALRTLTLGARQPDASGHRIRSASREMWLAHLCKREKGMEGSVMRHWNLGHQGVFVLLAWLVAIGTAAAATSTAEAKRLQSAAEVVRALRDLPDKGIPEKLWDRAECVIVIPAVKKAAL